MYTDAGGIGELIFIKSYADDKLNLDEDAFKKSNAEKFCVVRNTKAST